MDARQFADRVRACEQKLFHVARYLLPSETDREDAVQEAILKAWKNIRSLREEAYFETWLTRILINECKQSLRKRARRAEVALTDTFPAKEAEDARLQEALLKLEPKYRVPLLLHHLDGHDIESVARTLKITKGAVKWRLRRAKALLQAAYEEVSKE